MSQETLKHFIERHMPSAAALAALAAQLDARASGASPPPGLHEASQAMLGALGAGDVLDGVNATDAPGTLLELRHFLVMYSKLLYAETRGGSWNYDDQNFLQDAGDFARRHAMMLDKGIIPNLEGLAERIAAPGATFLDVGVGVAGLAIQLAELRPNVKVVGVDVLPPALKLARENVSKAGLKARIELREQGFETLTETEAFDLAWVPMPFIPERHLAPGVERVARALKPGGWVVLVFLDTTRLDTVPSAQFALTQAILGGPKVTADEVERLAKDKGLVNIKRLPSPPGNPATVIAAQKRG